MGLDKKNSLIAPCGMNCAVCSRYLSYVNNLKRSQCIGCRPMDRKCALLKKKCKGTGNILKGNISFCFECSTYPCINLMHLDERYRDNYGMSMLENLECIKKNGVAGFIKKQYKKYRCPECGDLISTHNGRCFHCEKITKLVEKTADRRMQPARSREAWLDRR